MREEVFNSSNYYFDLSPNLIAQEPVLPRDNCRLLVVEKQKPGFKETRFKDIEGFLNPGDVLVLNDTKVIMARLRAKISSGGKLEVFLLKAKKDNIWEALVNPGKRARPGAAIHFDKSRLKAVITGVTPQGTRIIKFESSNLKEDLKMLGQVPTPPYIKKEVKQKNLYQTVYAKNQGAVAAPTAGLHFTKKLLSRIAGKGVKIVYITLHCGLATFRPVKTSDIREHPMDSEWINLSSSAAGIINDAKAKGAKVFAVGTTVVRTLESLAQASGVSGWQVNSFSGPTNFYIVPGYKFKIVDALITNFHTPGSTNLILVSAFCSPGKIRQSYAFAQKHSFRFYSFGDAMLLL
ncbi:MAG: tRNA preQ1(34) S-adenosylmethionine ribosyltransferase-isomerase QueA [Candidatus Omnitrophica bacterium]|nr:tRNA preQ1(34) S-adenosylmethionine ribosyltransferase-isomerase QueA [Candidatus Omnitrophota bacterium]MDD5429989.1 tRNA preQ1(34) S-adenosylmethionine ribosyltransferase-isomerase QueA [Candidatus Omnitrophota bacterium]